MNTFVAMGAGVLGIVTLLSILILIIDTSMSKRHRLFGIILVILSIIWFILNIIYYTYYEKR